jgi:hypothetical protein
MSLYLVSYVYSSNGNSITRVYSEDGVIALASQFANRALDDGNLKRWLDVDNQECRDTLFTRAVEQLRTVWEFTINPVDPELVQTELLKNLTPVV